LHPFIRTGTFSPNLVERYRQQYKTEPRSIEDWEQQWKTPSGKFSSANQGIHFSTEFFTPLIDELNLTPQEFTQLFGIHPARRDVIVISIVNDQRQLKEAEAVHTIVHEEIHAHDNLLGISGKFPTEYTEKGFGYEVTRKIQFSMPMEVSTELRTILLTKHFTIGEDCAASGYICDNYGTPTPSELQELYNTAFKYGDPKTDMPRVLRGISQELSNNPIVRKILLNGWKWMNVPMEEREKAIRQALELIADADEKQTPVPYIYP
jgi:hypothetical protein